MKKSARVSMCAALSLMASVLSLAGCKESADPFSAQSYSGPADFRVHIVFREDESLASDDVRLLPSDRRMLVAPGVLHLVLDSHGQDVDSVMHFWCSDRSKARQLWEQSRSAVIVVNGKILDRTLLSPGAVPRRMGQECSFAKAADQTATCEAIAVAWGEDIKACRTPCPPWQEGVPPYGVCLFDLR